MQAEASPATKPKDSRSVCLLQLICMNDSSQLKLAWRTFARSNSSFFQRWQPEHGGADPLPSAPGSRCQGCRTHPGPHAASAWGKTIWTILQRLLKYDLCCHRLAALCHWTRTSWYAASKTTSNAVWSRCSSGAMDPHPSEMQTDAKMTKKNEWNLTVYNIFVTQSITMIHLWNECDKVRWKLMLVLYAAFMDMQKCQNVKVVRVVKVKLFTCYDDTV